MGSSCSNKKHSQKSSNKITQNNHNYKQKTLKTIRNGHRRGEPTAAIVGIPLPLPVGSLSSLMGARRLP